MPPFRRPSAKRLPKRRILIVCEGERSEPDYIRGVVREVRSSLIEIEIVAPAGATKQVVEKAAERKKTAERLAARTSDAFERFDEVWCAFDVDSHPNLQEALDQARANRIRVALSNPCFELWIKLHYKDQNAYIRRDKLQSECRVRYGQQTKHIPFDLLWVDYEKAKARAERLRKWQEENGRSEGNPWTTFDLLVESLKLS